jgi:hypothetical protein
MGSLPMSLRSSTSTSWTKPPSFLVTTKWLQRPDLGTLESCHIILGRHWISCHQPPQLLHTLGCPVPSSLTLNGPLPLLFGIQLSLQFFFSFFTYYGTKTVRPNTVYSLLCHPEPLEQAGNHMWHFNAFIDRATHCPCGSGLLSPVVAMFRPHYRFM